MSRILIIAAACGVLGLSVLFAVLTPRPAAPDVAGVPEEPAAVQSPQDDRLFAPRDLGLLETPDRDDWQKPDIIMDELQIADGSKVADLGTGGGWFSIRLARRVGPNGVVYAPDIQSLMIEATKRRVQLEGLTNVVPLLTTEDDPKLPLNELDAVIIVGSFHEMDIPARPEAILTLLGHVARALKPQGRLGIVDFLPGAGGPGPEPDARVDPARVIEAAAAAGLTLQKREEIPPFSFLLVFGKEAGAGAAR